MVDTAEQKQYWDAPGERRSPWHPAVQAFARPKIEIAIAGMELPGGDAKPTMLEVGAGNGYFSIILAETFDLTVLDFSQHMLDTNPVDAPKVCGDAQALSQPDKSFDYVFCGNLLHHLPDPVQACREMRRVARRQVALVEPNASNPLMFAFSGLKKEERGALKFTAKHVRGLAEQAGLHTRMFVTQGSIVPNATPPALVPWLQRVDFRQPLGFYHVGVFDV
ncbi:MAG: methyltransferase domain-containing protein [Deltaproteobacteria bacterium]|nr:methyltransferase domain-containing protein [Deltaproteobacteria bacterium]MBK8237645.1 methyltransferase domain-containing protein [Deltaproteobacteria bacterium]MBP7287562.1 methyltransferase domain-containing protein [Nannocystaceae bacterium]